MKKKVGTILDEDILLSAKQLAMRRQTSLSQVFEEAIRHYLKQFTQKQSIVQKTKGSFRIKASVLNDLLQEEQFFES